MNLILITGMPGARKSDVANILVSYGNVKFNMSDIIRQELDRLGMDPTPDNYHGVATQMRRSYGPDVLARQTLENLQYCPERFKVIDGLRTPGELHCFRENTSFVRLVAVHASRRRRYDRIRKRSGRELQALSQLERQDRQNLDLGVAELMALADYVIINGDYIGLSLEEATLTVYQSILTDLEVEAQG